MDTFYPSTETREAFTAMISAIERQDVKVAGICIELETPIKPDFTMWGVPFEVKWKK